MRSGLMYLPLFRLPLLPILLCSAGVAEAVALGKMTVLSHLGSRFEAEVQLLDTAAGKQPLAECFRLGQRGQSGESDIPLLTRARLTVEQRGSGLRLHIVSEQTISEPVLQVNLHAGCGAEVVHKYLLLVDPPLASKPPVDLPAVRMAAVAEPVSRQRPATGSPPGTPDSQVLAAARPVTNPGAASAGDTQTGLPPERQLPRKPFPGYGATDRLLLSGGADSPQPRIADDLPLRLSTRLSAQLLNKTTDNQRSMLRIEYQLLSALHTQAEQQLVVAEQVRRLDAALNDLQRKSLGQSSKQQTFVAAAVPAGMPQPATAPSRIAAAPVARVNENKDWWLEAGLLFGLVAGLTWLLRRRSGRASRLPDIAEPMSRPGDSSDNADNRHQTIGLAERPAMTTESEPVMDTTLLVPDGVARESAARDDDEATAVLQLAEIMISFGRVTGAAQVLEEFVEQKPTLAVTPWLKLLEVYRQNEQREAFEALGLRLTRHFNVAAADWESAEELVEPVFAASDGQAASIEQLLERLPRVGQLPHIRVAVTRTWNSPECLAYLHKLLRDNRDGERRGFPLGTARELLFLIDLLESRLAHQTGILQTE